MLRALSAASLLVLVATAANAAAPVRDSIIVPGERIGPVALGANLADIVAVLGAPREILHQGAATVYSWGPISAQIDDDAPGIQAVTIADARYETEDHLRVGLATLAVNTVLGAPTKTATSAGVDTLDYDGLSLLVSNGVVVQIQVRK